MSQYGLNVTVATTYSYFGTGATRLDLQQRFDDDDHLSPADRKLNQ